MTPESWLEAHAYLRPVAELSTEVDHTAAAIDFPDAAIPDWEAYRPDFLAGVTLLMHGHQGSIDGWVRSAADAIAERIGTSQTSQFIMKVTRASGDLAVTSFTLARGPAMDKSSTGEAIVKVDWTAVDNGDYSTEEVGKVVADYLMTAHGTSPPLAELPLHLIGHSRDGLCAVLHGGDATTEVLEHLLEYFAVHFVVFREQHLRRIVDREARSRCIGERGS